MNKLLAAVATFATLVFSNGSFAAPPAVWGFQKFPEALAAAQAANKPLFVLFGFETCGGCKRLYSGALTDEELRVTFQKNFVLAYVDTEGHGEPPGYEIGDDIYSHRELVTKYKGYPTPSWVWLTPAGARMLGDRGGSTTAREMMRDAVKAMEMFKAAPRG